MVVDEWRMHTPTQLGMFVLLLRVNSHQLSYREREWTRWTHTGGGKAPAFKPTPNATR
jgi:hypothetical protein